jgi:hypothetical protein
MRVPPLESGVPAVLVILGAGVALVVIAALTDLAWCAYVGLGFVVVAIALTFGRR